jgi:PleD family two-component response regulator
MTLDMKFEGLLVSRDLDVLREMSAILDDLSIDVDVCMLPSRALDVLAKRDLDLVMVDWENENGGSDIVGQLGTAFAAR